METFNAGYVLSLDWGDNLSHFDRLEAATASADTAIAEGYQVAQVWHQLPDSQYIAVDPDQECEYSVQAEGQE